MYIDNFTPVHGTRNKHIKLFYVSKEGTRKTGSSGKVIRAHEAYMSFFNSCFFKTNIITIMVNVLRTHVYIQYFKILCSLFSSKSEPHR